MATETALITGASSGIGRELVKLFASDRSNLILVARSEDKLESLAQELRRDHGIEVLVLPKDLADPAAPQAIFDQLSAEGRTVDVVVNNAGFGAVGPVASLAVEKQMDMIQVNVAALTHLSRLFLPGMVERGRGGILNVGSTAGFQPGPNMAVYYATKAFVLSFTEALAEELAGSRHPRDLSGPRPHGHRVRRRLGDGGLPCLQARDDGCPDGGPSGIPGFPPGQGDCDPRLDEPARSVFGSPGTAGFVRKLVKRLQG